MAAQTGVAAWGLDTKMPFAKHLLLGMLMGIFLYGLTFAVSLLLKIETVQRIPGSADILTPLGLFVFGNLFSSFSEDVLTRGYVYHHLKGRTTGVGLAIISAAIYLLNHIYRLGDGVVTWLYLFLLGILLVLPLILTRRLWFTGGVHWAGNVTFYFTHEIIKTDQVNSRVSPNYVLIIVILLFIPLNYFILKVAKLVKK